MTDNKLTDEQIIKALKCCIEFVGGNRVPCNECPLHDCGDCLTASRQQAIDLINRLKAEIESQRTYLNVDKIRAEAIEEFAERLKAKAYEGQGFYSVITISDIDNLVKEMVGDAEESSETKKSKWEIACDGYYPYCPNCGNEPPSGKMTNFCPKCGKDMRGDK